MKKYLFPIFILVALILTGFLYSQKELKIGATNEISADKVLEKYNASKEIKSKYVLNGTTLEKTDILNPELDKYKNEPKDEIKVTIGEKPDFELIGASAPDFTPSITLQRWNEVQFKITPKDLDEVATKDKTLSFDKDTIKFGTPKMSWEMFEVAPTETDEGSYKYIWYLNEKPATNKVEFQIETQGLDFFYQPPLTQEYKDGYSDEFKKEIVVSETQVKDLDGNVLVERPENVVGSYVVYHSTKGGMNDVYGKEYRTGQAFVIYRPRLIDAEGKETWGILHIENGIYSVEIPQDFLDNAVYPIKSNDTFGYTSAGGSSLAANDIFRGNVYTAPENGTLDSISVYSASYNVNAVRWGIYNDDASDALVGQTATYGSSYTVKWLALSLSSQNITSGTNYAIMYASFSSAGTTLYYDALSAKRRFFKNDSAATSYPDPWNGSIDIINTSNYSIYATYTPSGGGGTSTCYYSGSGNFNVLQSDNCYATTSFYVLGDFNLIGNTDGTGSYGCAPGIKISATGFNFGTGKTHFDMDCFSHHL